MQRADKLHEDIAKVLISKEHLHRRIKELGQEITRDYDGESILAVGVLKGAAVFLADLVRTINLDVDYDFVWISSYDDRTCSSGNIQFKKDVDAEVGGRHILIVEDIVDTGWTLRLSRLTENLLARSAASVKVCTLLDKPSRRQVEVPIHYRGFTIEDYFVVGYGLDLAGRYRNLPYIGILKPEIQARITRAEKFSNIRFCKNFIIED